jgi:hypothetical protein
LLAPWCKIFRDLGPYERLLHLDGHVLLRVGAKIMSWLFACVAHGHLFYEGSDVEASDIVGVVEVVPEIILGEVERDEEARVVW